MFKTGIAVGTIKKEGSQYCLIFSNGRKECFSSKSLADKRERQVQFFKNRSSGSEENAALFQLMADMSIAAQYCLDGEDDVIYVIDDGDTSSLFIVKGKQGEREVNLVIAEDLDEGAILEDYALLVDFIREDVAEADHGLQEIQLSESVIGEQLVKGSHTHTAIIDEAGDGKSSEDAGHRHLIFGRYIGSAPVDVNGVEVMHTHLKVVTPS